MLIQHDLPIPGYTAGIAAVEVPPGGREGRHTHPGPLYVYVQEGAITVETDGQPTRTYKAGDTFFIEGGKIHEGMNYGTATYKSLTSFVIPKGKPLTVRYRKTRTPQPRGYSVWIRTGAHEAPGPNTGRSSKRPECEAFLPFSMAIGKSWIRQHETLKERFNYMQSRRRYVGWHCGGPVFDFALAAHEGSEARPQNERRRHLGRETYDQKRIPDHTCRRGKRNR